MEYSLIRNECSKDLSVMAMAPVMVAPWPAFSKIILSLSNLDDQPMLRMAFNTLLVYNTCNSSANPVKVIREALSKALVYYYPLAGRLRKAQNGKLEVECTGEGAVFVEASANSSLSSLGELDDLKPSLEQLLLQFPPAADIEDIPPLVIQVTRFSCGGVIVAASFYHCLCDGRGSVQFLKGLAEIARGEVEVSIKPIWHRELLRPRNPPRVEFLHLELNGDGENDILPNYGMPIAKSDEELVQASLILDSATLKAFKQFIVCNSDLEWCSSFEVVVALAWRARTKALGIPLDHIVKLLFTVDVRKAIEPPLPEGYYGNGFVGTCALSTAQDLVNGSIIHTVKAIRKSKLAILNDRYLRSSIDLLEMNRYKEIDMRAPDRETLIVSDWTRLGFDEVDFGWGEAANACPLRWNGLAHANTFLFLRPPKSKDGVKMLVCLPKVAIKAFGMEIQTSSLSNRLFVWQGGQGISGVEG